jgi:tetratricopeptide (TPR) repeat protein
MDKLSEFYELFDRQANNELSAEEKKEFEERVKSDKELKKAFDEYRDIVLGIKAASEDHLRENMKQWDEESSRLSIRSASYYIYRIAAVFLFLIIGAAVVLILRQQKSTEEKLTDSQEDIIEEIRNDLAPDSLEFEKIKEIPDPEMSDQQELLAMQLYDDYFETYPNNLVPKSRGVPEDSLALAMYYYELEDFQQSLSLFEQLLTSEADQADFLFYSAICEMQLQNYEEALGLFQSLTGNEKYQEDINWYTALIFLHQNQISEALQLLEQLVVYSTKYKDRSENIVKAFSKKDK